MVDSTEITAGSFTQKLDSLKQLRENTQQLFDCKAQIIKSTELLESKTDLLEELKAERLQRLKEKRLLLDMIQGVQRDIDAITEMESALGKECEDLRNNMSNLKNEEYEHLHDIVNKMRLEKGLSKIPHVQQDMEAQMAKKLQERRENWQQGSASTSSTLALTDINTTSTNQNNSRNQRGRSKRRRQ